MNRVLILGVATTLAATVAATDYRAAPPSVGVVARAGAQELAGERLALMLAMSELPTQKEVAAITADLWVSYQLLGLAGARGDSMADTAVVDAAMWATIDSARATKFFEITQRTAGPVDTTNLAQKFTTGDLLAAQHILIAVTDDASPQTVNAARQRAETLLKKVTRANFNQMAATYTEEPGGRERNGKLGVFGPGAMLPGFESAVRALAPGAVSPTLVKTSFGFHIVRRQTLSEVRAEFIMQLQSRRDEGAIAGFTTKIETGYNLTVRPGSAAKAREVAKDPSSSLGDTAVLAISRHGTFTAGTLAKWLLAFSNGEMQRVKAEFAGSPDSVVERRVHAIAAKELVVVEAERANVRLSRTELNEIRSLFRHMVYNASRGLNVQPAALAGPSVAAREQIAAARADSMLAQALSTNGRTFVDIPAQVAATLRRIYPWRTNAAAIAATSDRAKAIRVARDSLRAKGN